MSGIRGAESAELFRCVNDRIFELGAPAFGLRDLICECPDAECTRVLQMTAGEFDGMRAEPGLYAVVPGHEAFGAEVAELTERYVLVRIAKAARKPEVVA
jgi:hypothetical protein